MAVMPPSVQVHSIFWVHAGGGSPPPRTAGSARSGSARGPGAAEGAAERVAEAAASWEQLREQQASLIPVEGRPAVADRAVAQEPQERGLSRVLFADLGLDRGHLGAPRRVS